MKKGEPPIPLWTIKSTYFLGSGANAFLFKFMNVYFRDALGLTVFDIATLLTFYLMSKFVGVIFWSFAADRSQNIRLFLVSQFVGGSLLINLIFLSNNYYYILTLMTIAGFFHTITVGLLDSVTLWVAQHSGETYGQQRLWSSVSWALFSLTSATFIHFFGYIAMFIGYAVIELTNASILWAYFPDKVDITRDANDVDLDSEQEAEANQSFFSQFTFEMLALLINLIVYSSCKSIGEEYFLIFLYDDWGASTMFMAFTIVTRVASEVVIFYYSDYLLKELGVHRAMIAAMILYAARIYLYTVVDSIYWYLVLEFAHGFTYSLNWVAVITYGREIAPRRYRTTMQGLIDGSYFVVGKAGGMLVGGSMYDDLGANAMWVAGSEVSFIWACLYALTLAYIGRLTVPEIVENESATGSEKKPLLEKES